MTKKRPKSEKPGEAWNAYKPRKRTPQQYETAACILDVVPPGQVERQKARRIIAEHSKDADEAREFMHMLGIYPDPVELEQLREKTL